MPAERSQRPDSECSHKPSGAILILILNADGSQGTASELLNCSAHRDLKPPTQADTSSMATGSAHSPSEQSSQGIKAHISNHSVPHKLRPRGKAKQSHTQLWNHAPDPKAYLLHSIQNGDLKHFFFFSAAQCPHQVTDQERNPGQAQLPS